MSPAIKCNHYEGGLKTNKKKELELYVSQQVMEMDNKLGTAAWTEEWLPYIAFPDVVGVFVYVSGQTKVTDLHDVVL